MGKRSDSYQAVRVGSVIGRGVEFEGTLNAHETIRIEGFIKGNVVSDGTVIIGRGGKIDGKIDAKYILIGGDAYGELFASEKIEVNPSGRVFGNIHTKALIVDEKALFRGTCEMYGMNDTPKNEEKVQREDGKERKSVKKAKELLKETEETKAEE